jgi:hypothetical protein
MQGTTPHFRFRFFFDWKSGTCLWSANDATRARFDYCVDPESLPLSCPTVQRIEYLSAWHDEFLRWVSQATTENSGRSDWLKA